jgi:YVTN family beta-propeller protein
MMMKYLVFSLCLISVTWALPAFGTDAEKLDLADGLKSGMLAVVNKSDNSISVIDIASQKIVKTLATGVGPHELVISNDGRLAVSTDFVGGDSLTVFDLKRLEVLRRISLKTLRGPHGIQFLADNQHVVFTSGKAKSLGVVNVLNGALVKTIATEQNTTHMLTYCNKDTTLYATNIRSHSISVVDVESGQKIKDITTEAMPEAIRCHKASGNIWYGANKDGKLLVIEPGTETVLASWDGFEFPYRVLFNHDESIAMVPDFSKHYVRFFNTKDNTEIATLELEKEAGPQGITLHPEKDIAFLSLNLQNKIVAIDIATQQVVAEYPTGNNPDGIIFFNRDTL